MEEGDGCRQVKYIAPRDAMKGNTQHDTTTTWIFYGKNQSIQPIVKSMREVIY